VADESALRCILAHEEAHLRQGDPFWNIIRICCIAIHWFNPFVWIAAGLSRQDAELSCDATAIRALGAESRFLYGRTLVGLLPVRSTSSRMFFCGTSLSYGRKGMKERISRITKKTRTVFPAAILLFSVLQ
jgi:beta-lactamase regulating signal transducer with metallopeptidase domain